MEVVDGGIVANEGVIPSSVGVEDRGVDVEGKDVVEDNCRALTSVLGVGDVVVVANPKDHSNSNGNNDSNGEADNKSIIGVAVVMEAVVVGVVVVGAVVMGAVIMGAVLVGVVVMGAVVIGVVIMGAIVVVAVVVGAVVVEAIVMFSEKFLCRIAVSYFFKEKLCVR